MTAAPSTALITIGLEVHVQVNTRSKMFCACKTSYAESPNTNTCPTCLGLPGALPVLNQLAIEKTILAGRMLGCSTPEIVRWDRKNYFYPDQAKNYQLSQLDLPLCLGGAVPLDDLAYPKDAQKSIARPNLSVALNRIHLEEDVAKSTHFEEHSKLDFNRAGTPLMEIVTEAVIENAEEVVAYLNSLRQILVYGDISDADMEKGQMRCDVNISVRARPEDELGPKIELKNLNSPSAIRRATNYEIERQSEELARGIVQTQSTRRWDDDLGQTELLRSKEDAHDYRYFPCPDLLPVATAELVKAASARMPELPAAKKQRFAEQYSLTSYDASVLASEQELADWFEAAAKGALSPKRVANWVSNELLALLNAENLRLDQSPLAPEVLRELTDRIEEKSISNAQAKEVFQALIDDPSASCQSIIQERGFEQVSDQGALEAMVEEVIAQHPDKAAQIQAGNEKLINWLTGQVMKASRGQANPQLVRDILAAKLLG